MLRREGASKVRVLVVDDEEFLRSIIRERLEIAGYIREDRHPGRGPEQGREAYGRGVRGDRPPPREGSRDPRTEHSQFRRDRHPAPQ